MTLHDILRNPDEHVRFAAYLDKLQQISDADELGLVSFVLTDPHRTMAQSAVLRHLDRRAADLYLGPAYERWAREMDLVVKGSPLLTQRLREWSLFRAIMLKLPWHREDLLASSNWLQLKTATEASARAIEILAEIGRTKRIRHAARTSLRRQGEP
jgi:hypothetical protein